MANMVFNANIIPASSDVTLGDSTHIWQMATSPVSNNDIATKNYVDNKLPLVFNNVSVATGLWTDSVAYTGYTKEASITCTGVTSTMIPDVIFNPTDATSGNFAPVCTSGNGTVTIYAKTTPATTITILTIKCE